MKKSLMKRFEALPKKYQRLIRADIESALESRILVFERVKA